MKIHCEKEGLKHEHNSVAELVECARGASLYVRVVPGPTTPKATGSDTMAPASGGVAIRDPSGRPTGSQLRYIDSLGGSWRDAYKGNKGEASQLIGLLKGDPEVGKMFLLPPPDTDLDDPAWESFPMEYRYRAGMLGPEWNDFDPTTGLLCGKRSGYSPPPPESESDDSPYRESGMTPDTASPSTKLMTAMPLLDKVPDGYYSVTDEKDRVRFLRLSRPKTGRYRGRTKVQVVSGEHLYLAWTHVPGASSASIYGCGFDIESTLLKLLVDWRTAALAYATEKRRCARCGTNLTDDRSRKYGIGPECEKHWPWFIPMVEEMTAAGEV